MATKTSKKRNTQAREPVGAVSQTDERRRRIAQGRRKLDAAMDNFHASKHSLDEAILRYLDSFTKPIGDGNDET